MLSSSLEGRVPALWLTPFGDCVRLRGRRECAGEMAFDGVRLVGGAGSAGSVSVVVGERGCDRIWIRLGR